MNFLEIQKLSGLLAKNFAEDFLKLLANYQTISASEAASRLNLHIKTAQDFLEALHDLSYLSREEIIDKKRPYFRYKLQKHEIQIHYDINQLKMTRSNLLHLKIRERKDTRCIFNTSPKTGEISSFSFPVGVGRTKKERKIQLTKAQGKFLIHLPFPSAEFKSVNEIIIKADISQKYHREVLDLLLILSEFDIIESKHS